MAEDEAGKSGGSGKKLGSLEEAGKSRSNRAMLECLVALGEDDKCSNGGIVLVGRASIGRVSVIGSVSCNSLAKKKTHFAVKWVLMRGTSPRFRHSRPRKSCKYC